MSEEIISQSEGAQPVGLAGATASPGPLVPAPAVQPVPAAAAAAVPTPPAPVYHQFNTQNVNVIVAQSKTPFLVRAIWFVFIGWWLSGLAMAFAWFLIATVVGMPLAFMIFNKVPKLQTLRDRTLSFSTSIDAQGNVTIAQATVDQYPLWVRAVWFVFAGWWLGAAATFVAWMLSVLVVTLPLAVMLIDRLPFIITLQRN